MTVAIFAGAPGIFNNIALIAPPATVDVYTAPNIIKPCSAVIWKVKGINKATAIVGLSPGAAPINKPPTVPNIRIKIFAKVNTFEK